MTPEQELMAKVKASCGPWIDAAVAGTVYPASLLAALTANESGGDPGKSRFEPRVCGQLASVIVGHQANFGSIGAQDLKAWCDPPAPSQRRAFDQSLLALVNLATSWGPTQIMGYQALAGGYDLGELPNLNLHYPHAVAMLEDFRKRWKLSPPANDPDVASYFHCWNGGSPEAQTTDSLYIPNGLSRKALYEAIAT